MTIIYFVRHAESVYSEGNERIRGLTEQGIRDAEAVSTHLRSEAIDLFYSSPYERAIATIRPAAGDRQREIHLEEDLRERAIGDYMPLTFMEAKQRVYEDMTFAFPGGESGLAAQKRAIQALTRIILENERKRIAIGTHGDIMTLMLNDFDKVYGFSFWKTTTMPDIYKLSITRRNKVEMSQIWNSD